MSNCIEFATNTELVRILAADMDLDRLRALVDPNATRDDPANPDAYFAYWFLEGNTTVDAHGATIRFGQGRSSHTWRDWRGTIETINKLMRPGRAVMHTFTVYDDGYENPEQHPFTRPVIFQNGGKLP